MTERIVCRMFFLGRNSVFSLICTPKSKKTPKTLKLFFLKKLGFFQPWFSTSESLSETTDCYHSSLE